MAVPEEHGGAGVDDFRFNAVLSEEAQRAGLGSVHLGMSVHSDICLPYFLSYATDEQKQRWLPGLVNGELIAAIAMTEPGTGSDLAGIATTAVRKDGEYVVNGAKTFITNGINADLVDHGRAHRPQRAPPRPQPAGGGARHSRLRARAQPREGRDARAGHGGAVLRRRARAGREPARQRGRGLRLPRLEPAAGAAVDRGRRRRGCRGRARMDGRVRARPQGLRDADRLVPEHALRAGRDAHRGRRRRRRTSTAASRR